MRPSARGRRRPARRRPCRSRRRSSGSRASRRRNVPDPGGGPGAPRGGPPGPPPRPGRGRAPPPRVHRHSRPPRGVEGAPAPAPRVRVPANFEEASRCRRRVLGLRRRATGGRHLGRRGGPHGCEAVVAGHAGGRVLHHEGATAICAHMLVQPGRSTSMPPSRTTGPSSPPKARNGSPSGRYWATAPGSRTSTVNSLSTRYSRDPVVDAIAAAAELGTGNGARLPHAIVRWIRRRDHPPRRRSLARTFLCRRGRGAVGPRLLGSGLPGVGGAARSDHGAARAAGRSGSPALVEQLTGPDTFLGKVMAGPSGLFAYDDMWNTPPVARSRAAVVERHRRRTVGRGYAATTGDVDGVRLLDPDTVAAASGCSRTGPTR